MEGDQPRRSVLFIDDRAPDFEGGVRQALPSFVIAAYQDPLNALEQFRFSEVEPDLILLDVNFTEVWHLLKHKFPDENPEFFGIRVLEMLRRMDPDIPVIILTAYERLEAAFKAGKHAANLFLIKREALDEKRPVLFESQVNAILEKCHYSYDRDQKELADRVADQYRILETSKPGTVAYWHFEEQLIIQLIREAQARKASEIRVLDIGTGDGRYEEVIFREFRDQIRIKGIDFSGKMLKQCRTRLSDQYRQELLTLERAVAEQIPFPDDSFDIVIAGFGFLSYCDTPRVLKEIQRVASPDSRILLGSYNYDALFYDVWEKRLEHPDVPISGKIDRERGLLFIGPNRKIHVHPARLDEMRRQLMQNQLDILQEWTFPTLYSTLGCSKSQRMPEEMVDPANYHGFVNFSPRLYEQDVVISLALQNRGYYSLYLCRPSSA